MTYATLDTTRPEEVAATLPGRVTYVTSDVGHFYMYVTAVVGDTVLGATVNDAGDTARWVQVPLSAVQGWTYALADFAAWVEPITALFRPSGEGTGTVSTDVLAEAREEGRREAEQRHAEFMDRLVRDAHEYANDNDLCGVFDEFMESHGLPRRTRDYRVEFRVSFTSSTVVEASSSDEAAELVADDPSSYIDRYSVELDSPDVDIIDVYVDY